MIRKGVATMLTAIGTTTAFCQVPDTQIKVDLNFHYNAPRSGQPTFRLYDSFGRHSKLMLYLTLEPGFRVVVSERLQKIDGNADSDQLDEAYLEDPRLWRIGKQYLPFGRQTLFNDSAIAARGETTLLLGGYPIVGAVFDNGDGEARGAAVRAGGRIGISAAVGNNLAAQATSLTLVRAPEASPGLGRGYKTVLGTDFYKKLGRWVISGEFAMFRNGETVQDDSLDVSDLLFSFESAGNTAIRFGWTREWRDSTNFFRGLATVPIHKNVWVEPFVRVRNASIHDAGFSFRIRF